MNTPTTTSAPVSDSAPSSDPALKRKNPHELPLGKFLRGREQHVTTGYLRNEKTGQIRKDTVAGALGRWREEAVQSVNSAPQEAP